MSGGKNKAWGGNINKLVNWSSRQRCWLACQIGPVSQQLHRFPSEPDMLLAGWSVTAARLCRHCLVINAGLQLADGDHFLSVPHLDGEVE